ncbi:hypothetical protein ACR3K2_17160 [Cryptosporidium serpentis]
MSTSNRLKDILENGEVAHLDCYLENYKSDNETNEGVIKHIQSENLNLLHALNQREVIHILDRVLGGGEFESVLRDIAEEYLGTHDLENKTSNQNYAEKCADALHDDISLNISETFAGVNIMKIINTAKYVPLRINVKERQMLRLIEGALEVSEYTDRVDVICENKSRRIVNEVRQVCAILSGLAVSFDYENGQKLVHDRNFKDNEIFFQNMFEIARRYKMLNPERMRDSYGKLLYLLMDTQKEEIQELLQFKCCIPILTVYDFLNSKGCLELLNDPLLYEATRNIEDNKDRNLLNKSLTKKRMAIKDILSRYSAEPNQGNSSKGIGGPFSRFWMYTRSNDSNIEENENYSGSGLISSSGGLFRNKNRELTDRKITKDELELCIYSLNDHNVFLYYNRDPINKMIQFLKDYFDPNCPSDINLSLIGSKGTSSRLNHDHHRQYFYVLQSLTMWREVMDNMMRLWCTAEDDLLDEKNRYRLGNTGQGIHRIQGAPRLYKAMCEIVSKVQSEVGSWVGSSVIHLGDRNVPNALMFIDKYLQIPKILSPIVLCLESIDEVINGNKYLKIFVENCFGGCEKLKKIILADFFKHGFDGGGADNFFDAGSCIDGRLTSAWNWCSRIESKAFFPIFLLCGFVGFDGKF